MRSGRTDSLESGEGDSRPRRETLEETALREVQEETGLEPVIEERIRSIDYWFSSKDDDVRYHKTVHFYLMRAIGGDTSLHDPEF